ncbi:MAG: hypothetical protein Q4P15_06995 [Propionibacteriaceae bacterium]|nr:hypothetical protein [Propionibacteriaceae bacterium]
MAEIAPVYDALEVVPPLAPPEPLSFPPNFKPLFTVETDISRCLDPLFQVPLAVVTDIAEEESLLHDVAACTNLGHSALWLGNYGEVVWTAKTSFGGGAVRYSTSLVHQAFRDFVASETYLLVPGGGMVIEANPATVSWLYNAELSAGWGTLDVVQDIVKEKAPGLVAELHDLRTPRSRALGVCVVSTISMAQSFTERIEKGTTKPSDAITTALGTVASGLACHDAWRIAESAPGPAPFDIDDLSKLTSVRSQQLSTIDKNVTRLFQLQRIAGFIAKVR